MRITEILTESTASRQGIELTHQFIPATDDMDEKLLITATTNGKNMGRAYFLNYDGDWEASDVEVDERFRGQGVAKVIYDYAKELIGPFHRSPDQTDAGAGFWAKHRGEKAEMWEGAPELLKAEMPLVRHIEKELAAHGYEKGTAEYNEHFKHALAYYRKFGNVDAIKKGVSEMDSQGYKGHRGDEDPGKGPEKVVKPAKAKDVAKAATKVLNKAMDKAHKKGLSEGSGNWYIRYKGKVLKDKKFNAIPFPNQEAAHNKAMELHHKKRYPFELLKLTQSWMDAPEQGVAEGFFGIDDKIKGKIQNIVSDLSDIPGMWDHKAQTFTPAGLEKLKSILKNNPKYIKYAVNLTVDDYEAEGVAEGIMDTIKGAAKEFTRDSLQRKIKQAWEHTFWPRHIEPALNRIQINGQPFRRMVLGEPRVIENKRSQRALLKQYTVDIVFPIDPRQWAGDEIQYLEGQLQDIQDGDWNPKVHGLGLVSFDQPMKSFQYTRGETPDLVIPVRITSLDINRGLVSEHNDGRDDEPEEIDDDGMTMADRARRDGRGGDDEDQPMTAAQRRRRSLQATRDFKRGRRSDQMREQGVAEGEKNKAYTQGSEAGKKSHRAENNPYKSGSPEHREWEAGRKGTVPDRSRFLPSKKGVAEGFQTTTCPKCLHPHEFYGKHVPPCPKCGYPELKTSDEYYKSMGVKTKKEQGVAEGLDANQKRVGQLGPTEKVKNNNIGKLVGTSESVDPLAEIKRLMGK